MCYFSVAYYKEIDYYKGANRHCYSNNITYSANEGKIGIIESFYSPNYVITFMTFIIIFVVFITFIFTSITIVSTNCKLPRDSEVYDCM